MKNAVTNRRSDNGSDPTSPDIGKPCLAKANPIVPRLLSQREAATYLGISYWTLRDLTFRGEIPHVKIRRRILVDRLDLDAYLDRMKVRSGS
ncbi:MAG: helix-turn-helix domain-containing protein [Nitrospira sp.]|nr:helix-turn-helix domain-containing protein [Nitrospira sp.]